MSSANRVAVRYVEESVFGTTPASALTAVRHTGESLAFNVGTTESAEIRDDRNISDIPRVSAEAAGGFNFELSAGNLDDLIEGLMYSSWSTAVNISATDIGAATATSNFTSSSTNFTTENISAGQWIKVAGFTNSDNNGYFKVTSVAANSLVVSPSPGTTESAGNTITMVGSMIRNGTTRTSYTLEKEFADITQFISYTGMVPNTFTLTVNTGAIATGTISFMGLDSARDTSTVGTGGPNSAPTNDIMTGVANVYNVLEGGSAPSAHIQRLEFNLNNNLRGNDELGTLGHFDIKGGDCKVDGSALFYFADGSIYDKYLAGTASSLSYRMEDSAGNAYVFTFPNVKYTQDNPVAGSKNTDVMDDARFQALLDATTNCTIQIDKI